MNTSSLTVATASPPTSGARPVAPKLPQTEVAKPAALASDPQKLSVAASPSQNAAAPTADDLQQLLDQMQTKLASLSKDLRFSIDQDSGKTLLTMTDHATKEVILQIPSEVAMRLSKTLDRSQKGFLLSSQA